MTARAATDVLVEMSDRHGILTGALAVFGCTPSLANEPLPRWVDDAAQVRRRVARKADDELDVQAWRAVAALVTHCATLLRPRIPELPLPRHPLECAAAAAAAAAQRLPAPPRAVLPQRGLAADSPVAAWWTAAGIIEAAAVHLCAALDDRSWTDPDAVAGWVADAGTALAGLHRTADGRETTTVITLDTGKRVRLVGGEDCCAYTDLEAFRLHPDKVDHIITGVGTTNGYTTWHVYADAGDVLELTVGCSPGNPFYYCYGFTITVEDAPG